MLDRLQTSEPPRSATRTSLTTTERICGWCGFTPTGEPRRHQGVTFCLGPGVPEPTCWQLASSEGDVVRGDFGRGN